MAKQNNVVGVTDVAEFPGAGQLHFEDGSSILALPEVADPYRERFGHSALQGVAGDNAANPEAPGPALKREPGTDIYGLKPGEGAKREPNTDTYGNPLRVVQGEPSAPAPGPAAPAAAAPEAAAAAAPGAAAGAPSAPPSISEQLAAANERRQAQVLSPTVWDPGSAGRAAGFTPSAQRTTTEAGPEYRQEDADARAAAGKEYLAAMQSKADAEKAEADARAEGARVAGLQEQQKAAELEADNQRKTIDYQRKESAMQKELADYSESEKPDPKKFWSTPGGAVSGLLSIIGQGLGAFAAVRSGTENFAMKAAQEKIRQELAAQEKAYDAGRGDRKNALARLTQYYDGDIEMGRLALAQSLNKVAETETTRLAAQSRSTAATNNARILAADFAQKQLEAEQARRALADGKSTRTVDERYQSAVAARAPGERLKTEAETKAGLAEANAIEKGKTKEKDSDFQSRRLKYGEKKEAESAARVVVDKLGANIGARRNPQTGMWEMPPGKEVNVPGHGSGAWKPDAAATQKGRDFRNDMADLVLQTGKAVSGADVPEGTLKQIEKMSGASGADSDILPGLNRLQAKLDAAALDRDATYGLDVKEAHEAERRKVVAANKANPANAKRTPE